MTRAEALKTAEDLVTRLVPSRDGRGFGTDSKHTLGERISAILRVADFLMTTETEGTRDE